MRQTPPEGGVWGGVRLANAAEPRTTPVARNATETKQITHDLVFTYDHQGGPRTRMGSVGRDPLLAGTADAGIFAEKTTSVGNVCSQAGWMFAAEKAAGLVCFFKQDGWKTDSVRDASAGG